MATRIRQTRIGAIAGFVVLCVVAPSCRLRAISPYGEASVDPKALLLTTDALPPNLYGGPGRVGKPIPWRVSLGLRPVRPTDTHVCPRPGREIMRRWNQNGEFLLDPGAEQYVCELPDSDTARDIYESASIGDAANWEEYPNIDRSWEEPDEELHPAAWHPTLVRSDASRFVCLGGNANRLCSAWLYHSLYGRYVVRLRLTAPGSEDFSYEQFLASVRALDRHVSNVLLETV